MPGGPHRAEAGLNLCRTHVDELGEALFDVEREAEAVEAAPSMALAWGDGGGGGLKSQKAPARVGAVVAHDTRIRSAADIDDHWGLDDALPALGVLHKWAAEVRDGRDLAVPTRQVIERMPRREGPLCEGFPVDCPHWSCRWLVSVHRRRQPLTLTGERQLLTRYLEWCAAQPWAGDMFAQVMRLRSQLQALNGTTPPGPLPGRCPRLDEALTECGGRLWPVKAGEVVQVVQCDRDSGHRWEGRELVRLAMVVAKQQREDAA